MVVPEIAFEIMRDRQVRSFDQLGRSAFNVLSAWAAQRVRDNAFDDKARALFVSGVRQILADHSTTFRKAMYSLFPGPIGDAIPESKEILTAAALAPNLDDEGVDDVARVLEHFVDLATISTWLVSKDETKMRAGMAVLDRIDHRRIDGAAELRVLTQVAANTKLPANIAYRLIDHVRGHEDVAFAPVLDALAAHTDPEVASAARDARKAMKGGGEA
jgi:hypothetical protein